MEARSIPVFVPRRGWTGRHLEHLAAIRNPFEYVRAADRTELKDRLEWVLRLTVALCFLGHGFWGAVSKPGFVALVTPLGFSQATARALLPYVGWGDILLAALILHQPRGAWLWKAFLWACFTALLRPLAGMSWFEVTERTGNYGIPLAFLVLAGGMGLMPTWWRGIEVADEPDARLSDELIGNLKLVLQLTLGLLLIGHGGLMAVAQKPVYLDQLRVLGMPASQSLVSGIGCAEMALGAVLAVRPTVPLVWTALVWKLATESLYPFVGRPVDVFETIERWGDYGACVALLLILHYLARSPATQRHTAGPDAV